MAYGILKPAKAYPDTFEEAFDVSKFFMCLRLETFEDPVLLLGHI